MNLQNLQNDVKAFQKKAKKEKLSKKDTDAHVQRMESDLKARHEEELASLEVSWYPKQSMGYRYGWTADHDYLIFHDDSQPEEPEESQVPAQAEAAVLEPIAVATTPSKPQGPSKAQRRRVRFLIYTCVH